jgi:purine-binding chemotaxis protein CheW
MTNGLDGVQQVRGVPQGNNQGSAKSGDRMVCLIELDGQSLALRTSAVREVIGNAVLVTVPLAPSFLAGIVNHRGLMLTTVSLRSVLGLPPAEGKNCVVVLRADAAGGESFGLLVDQVVGVLTLDDCALEKVPATVPTRAQDLFHGMYVRETGPLVELNVEHLRADWLAASAHSSEE